MEKEESVVQSTEQIFGAIDGRKFEVRCRAGEAGALHTGAESLQIQIGQLVRVDGAEEMWDSIAVYASEDQNGNLVVRVLVFNPDWEEPLQIASITSRPSDRSCLTTLGCNLNHQKG